MKLPWKNISLFIFLAFAISAPVHLGLLDNLFQRLFEESIFERWTYLFAGLGPFIAALAVMKLRPKPSTRISIWGNELKKNLLIASLPVIVFSILGFKNDKGINIHLYGFIYASLNVVYAFFEEFGWRKYLQNALESLNKHWKYLLIGLLWWLWHFRFETEFDLFVFPLICIGGGYLLGKLADDTKSIIPVVNLHAIMILLSNSGTLDSNRIYGAIFCFVAWILIEYLWKAKKAKY